MWTQKTRLPLPGLIALAACACSPGDEAPDATLSAAASAAVEPAAVRPADAEPAIFVDAAAEAGLVFEHQNGSVGEYFYAEMMGSGAALFDYDNDGDLDVYLVQGGPLAPGSGSPAPADRLFRNDLEVAADGGRRLRFVDVTEASGLEPGGYGMGVAAADFNNDGWIDLYVTNLDGNRLLRNRGADGGGTVTFEDVSDEVTGIRRWSVPAVVVDYDRDGLLDLFVGNYVDYTPGADQRCTDELGARNYCGPLAYGALPDNLLRNRSQGRRIRFEDTSDRTGVAAAFGRCLGAAAADFDGDGWPDLYVANDGTPNQLWMSRRTADGTVRFEDRALVAGTAVSGQGVPEASMGVAVTDFDFDGDEDVFVSHLSRETNTLYVNDGRGLFVDGTSQSGLGAASFANTGFGTGFFDYDNDGRLDQLTVNGAVKVIKSLALRGDPFPLHQRNQLFHQLQDGTFEETSNRAGPVFELSEVSRGAAFGDLDNDGDADVVVVNNGGPVRLLENRRGQDQGWIGLRLVVRSRDAVGARAAIVFADGTTRWQRVTVTSSYASSNDPRLIFGLGDGEPPVGVLVEWPGGRRERWSDVAAGTYTTLTQGTGKPVEGGA